MQPILNRSFGFPYKQCWYSIYCFVLLSIVMMLFGISTSNSAHAASIPYNQIVTIAVDTTSPSCVATTTIRSHITHKILSVTHTKCPAGTSVSLINIPLKLAQAQHEAYVIYPAPHASQ